VTATTPLLRVAVVGATGALGGELLDQLRERRFPLQELRPIATDRSLGATIDWLGHELPVATEPETLRGLDLVLVCTPPAAALDWIRRALQAGVACIDFSGAVAGRAEVPLLDADEPLDPAALAAPLLAVPAPASLALVRVLAPIREEAGLARVSATLCEAASGAGRVGVDALQAETIALFNQEDMPETGLDHALAFDCLPASGPLDEAGESALEARVAGELGRLLGEDLPRAVTVLRVPTFAGMGIQLALETERELAPLACLERLGKTPGIASRTPQVGPTTREAIGEDDVLVGRVRRDPSAPRGLLLWLALDPARLAASNALRIAEARFRAA
jgi:aspartate-semialdehyde dehydrogenase